MCYQVTVQDLYEVLGLERDASVDDVKAAFRRLAQKYHPDRNPGDDSAQQRFKEINSAYQVLSDPEKKARYDRFGASGLGGSAGPGPGGVDFVDLGNLDLDGIFGDLLRGFGVRTGGRTDLKKEVTVTLEEAAFGCEKQVTYERLEPCTPCRGSGAAPGSPAQVCPTCMGRGRIRVQQGFFPIGLEHACSRCHGKGRVVTDPCPECRGAGVVTVNNTVTVVIPPGIEDGSTRVVRGAGNVVRPDGTAGDLELGVCVEPHPRFRRDGDDILCSIPITIPQAVLGGEVEVPTLDGKGKVRVPAGTQSGAILRIRGKGIVRRTRTGRGDQLVEVNVDIPKDLSERQRELFEQLAHELGDEVKPAEPKNFVQKIRDLFG